MIMVLGRPSPDGRPFGGQQVLEDVVAAQAPASSPSVADALAQAGTSQFHRRDALPTMFIMQDVLYRTDVEVNRTVPASTTQARSPRWIM